MCGDLYVKCDVYVGMCMHSVWMCIYSVTDVYVARDICVVMRRDIYCVVRIAWHGRSFCARVYFSCDSLLICIRGRYAFLIFH